MKLISTSFEGVFNRWSQLWHGKGEQRAKPADSMAEGQGFEPRVRFPVQRFSRPPVSTTHASLRPILFASLAGEAMLFSSPACWPSLRGASKPWNFGARLDQSGLHHGLAA